jgi:hypothetical protein
VHLGWVVLACVGGAVAGWTRERRRSVFVIGTAVAAHTVYVLSVNGDFMHIYRFYLPVLAPLAYLFGLLLGTSACGIRSSPGCARSTCSA